MPDLRFALFVEPNKITRGGAIFQPRHANIPLENFDSRGPSGRSWQAESWRGCSGGGSGGLLCVAATRIAVSIQYSTM